MAGPKSVLSEQEQTHSLNIRNPSTYIAEFRHVFGHLNCTPLPRFFAKDSGLAQRTLAISEVSTGLAILFSGMMQSNPNYLHSDASAKSNFVLRLGGALTRCAASATAWRMKSSAALACSIPDNNEGADLHPIYDRLVCFTQYLCELVSRFSYLPAFSRWCWRCGTCARERSSVYPQVRQTPRTVGSHRTRAISLPANQRQLLCMHIIFF